MYATILCIQYCFDTFSFSLSFLPFKKERKTLILAIFSLSLQQQNIENENGKCKEVFVGNDTWRTERGCQVARNASFYRRTDSQVALYTACESIDEMTNISKANREKLAAEYAIGCKEPIDAQHSKDGTIKYLFPTDSGKFVETVYIPDEDRATLCVSSQVGCKMNCLFCQTGKQGFEGSLSATDILNQIYSLPERDKLTNIVFMGQGEPMDNLDNVLRTTEIMTADFGYGWSPKRITVSSVGVKES